MENQSMEDKLSVLTNIFGNDLTDDVIADTLKANNDDFDATVEKLLTLPANKPKEEARPQQPQQPQPMDPKSLDNIKRLQNMFGDLTQSVITTVYESNKRDVEGTVDTLLNFTSNEVASGTQHNNRDAEVARQEQEIKSYEEFKRLQQRLQEEERKQAKEEELARKKAAEEELAKRKAAAEAQQILEKKAIDEHTRALQEQEKMLLEFQRKKQEQDKLKEQELQRIKEQERLNEALKKKEAEVRLEKDRQMDEEMEALEMQMDMERAALHMQMEKEKSEKASQQQRLELEKQAKIKLERERKAAEERAEKERADNERKIAEERRLNEEAIAYKKLVEQNEILKRQTMQAEAERKLFEARMVAEMKRDWDEKVTRLESERRLEEQKRVEEDTRRMEAKRAEEEAIAQREAAMKKVLEMERLKLEEQRKRIDEERKSGEARLKAMEEAARQREEEEAQRLKAEEERQKAEEERKREEEERARLLQEEAQARERIKEDLRKALAQEQFAASAILVDKAGDEPKVEITAELDGVDGIKGSWTLVQGVLPPQAWLGLFGRRAMNTNSGYSYISGTTGEFNFKGLTPGHYEVRVFANKPVTSRIAESAALLVGPQVVRFTVQQQGGQLMMEYSLDPPASPSSRDWVGLYERSQRRNQSYLTTVYGNNTGVMTMPQPKKVGEYEVRLFVTGAKYNDQAAVKFTVEDNDQISAEVVDEVIKAKWVMRTVETAGGDWIGLFAAGGDNNNNNSNKYLVSVYTNSLSEGSIDIPIPKDIPKGLYELRLFASKVGKYVTFKTSDVITLN